MPLYRYKARSLRGDLLEGTLDAASPDAVASQLSNGGVTPIEIAVAATESDVLADIKRILTSRPPDIADMSLFCRQMYTLLKSGVPIVRGMRGLTESTRNPRMVEVLCDVTTDLESGRDLASALSRYPDMFSSLFVSMVRVGENTGGLDEAFLRIGKYLELERETRERIKAAVRYPITVVVAIGIAVAIINVWVIPAFAKVFASARIDLPWATQVLLDVSSFFVAWWPHLLVGLVVGVAAVTQWMRTEAGRYQWDKHKLRLPLVGSILRRATLSRFARSFALTSRAGVPLIQSLTVVARAVGNEYVGDRVAQMRNGIERGDTLTRTAAASGLFTPLVLQMLAVGEETGAVDELLEEVAGFYEREVDHDLKSLSSSIEPILIVAVGIMVLILALGVFLPMWDLASGVGLRK